MEFYDHEFEDGKKFVRINYVNRIFGIQSYCFRYPRVSLINFFLISTTIGFFIFQSGGRNKLRTSVDWNETIKSLTRIGVF